MPTASLQSPPVTKRTLVMVVASDSTDACTGGTSDALRARPARVGPARVGHAVGHCSCTWRCATPRILSDAAHIVVMFKLQTHKLHLSVINDLDVLLGVFFSSWDSSSSAWLLCQWPASYIGFIATTQVSKTSNYCMFRVLNVPHDAPDTRCASRREL